MSVFNEEQFKEGLVSELALFDLPSTQTSVTDTYFEEFDLCRRCLAMVRSNFVSMDRIQRII